MNNERSKILIVDDEATNVRLLERTLEKEYEIHTAVNGFQAMERVKEQLPDLVLLDVMMPGISGFDVSRALKAEAAFAAIPIIFLTAMNSFEGELEGLSAGGIDYVAKPVNLELLKLRVHNHLQLKRQSDLLREQRDLLSRQKNELETALARIKRLEGTISICMHCKSIRKEDASWEMLEKYISDNSDAFFSHGICPDCLAAHYPECC